MKRASERRWSWVPRTLLGLAACALFGGVAFSQHAAPPLVADAVAEAQTPRAVPETRPEQRRTAHDRSDVFSAHKAEPSSTVLQHQPDHGKVLGFDFYRDPLDSKRPMQSPDEIMQADIAA